MSERKVLNKYYPPDFDPTKLPKLPKDRNRQFVIRIMAPFSMRCKTCGEYIYKGRKFNSRVETAEGENYLGLRIYRFYIRCTKCITEITFKTDPQNTDYVMEHGATRNFEAFKKMQKRVDAENQAILDEEENNPMKALENRTKDSKREMESIEMLGELKDLNQRIASVDHDQLIEQHLKEGAAAISKQEVDDEELVRRLFGGGGDPTSAGGYVSRILDDASSSDDEQAQPAKKKRTEGLTSSTDVLTAQDDSPSLANAPGPSKPKPKPKVALKIQSDISSMVKPKPKEVEVKSETEQPSTSSITENADSATLQDATVDEPAPLPAYKIVLPKTEIDNQSKMKGSSLSLLGGYSDSDNSDQSED